LGCWVRSPEAPKKVLQAPFEEVHTPIIQAGSLDSFAQKVHDGKASFQQQVADMVWVHQYGTNLGAAVKLCMLVAKPTTSTILMVCPVFHASSAFGVF
jgi:hypothetical protein